MFDFILQYTEVKICTYKQKCWFRHDKTFIKENSTIKVIEVIENNTKRMEDKENKMEMK